MGDQKNKEGRVICKVDKKRVEPPASATMTSEASETPLASAAAAAFLPPCSDDAIVADTEIDLRSQQIPGVTCSEGRHL